jgi:predicted metal-dependent hydrolase
MNDARDLPVTGAQFDLLFEPWPLQERVSRRARRVRVEVRPDGVVVLTVPQRISRLAALRFLEESRGWIERTRRRVLAAARDRVAVPGAHRAELKARAEREARALLDEECARLGLRYAGLRIRDPRTRWGSCGPDGQIMLSMRLALAPPEVFRYVVVHELCHLRWHGHGTRFWQLVERQMPDFETQRAWLRRHGAALHEATLT